MDRRDFLKYSAAATLGLGLAGRGWAATQTTVGGMTVRSVSDGNLVLPPEFIFGPMPKDQLPAVLAEFGMTPETPLTPPCNVTLLQHDDRIVLFDAGAGSTFQPSAGDLSDNLDALGLTVDDITHVVFTHAHPDHIWGILDDFDDPMFPNAEMMIGQAEFDYWMDPNTVDTIGAERTAFAVGAKRRLEMIADMLTFFNDGDEVLSGVMAHGTFGHTPGHMSFELRDGSESLLITGDAVANGHVAFARPDWLSGSDQDPDTAAVTRRRLLDMAAADKMTLLGFHLRDGGIGRAEPKDGNFRFAPVDG